jgi:hypothetical protein
VKKVNISLGSETLTLNLGVNYFYKFCKEATGIDLIKDGVAEVESIRLFDYAKGLVYGGYAAECAINKVAPSLTPDDVEYHIMSMGVGGVMDIVQKCAAAMNGDMSISLENDGEKNDLSQAGASA